MSTSKNTKRSRCDASPCYLQQFIPCNRLAALITCCSWYVKGSRGYQSRLHFNPVAGPDHLNAGIVLRLVGRSPGGALQSSRSPNRFLFVFLDSHPLQNFLSHQMTVWSRVLFQEGPIVIGNSRQRPIFNFTVTAQEAEEKVANNENENKARSSTAC